MADRDLAEELAAEVRRHGGTLQALAGEGPLGGFHEELKLKSMYICIYIYIYVCKNACLCVCMYACMYVCMYVCVYACICVCIHEYIYIYIHS